MKSYSLVALASILTLLSGCSLIGSQRIHYKGIPVLGHEVLGNGQEKVILLHGWFSNSSTWDPMKPYLDLDKFTYVFANVRGYHTSSWITGDYSTDEVARDILHLADYMSFGRFHVVGHSMTGMGTQKLAIRLAQAGDDRLKTLIGVTPPIPTGLTLDEVTREFLESAPKNPEVLAEIFGSLTGNRYTAGWESYKTEQNLKHSPTKEVMLAYMNSTFGSDGFFDLATEVQPKLPTLIIAGAHDEAGPVDDYQKMMPQAFPNMILKVIGGAGHYPMNETPVELATILENHLEDHR